MENKINKNLEIDLLNNPDKLCFMNNLLRDHQFSEDFLIKTIGYYDSWKCLRYQKNLSPEFCFKYLYDNDTDSADDWTDYNDINEYLLKYGYTKEEIQNEFNKLLIK
jgi:hypothetical protein